MSQGILRLRVWWQL